MCLICIMKRFGLSLILFFLSAGFANAQSNFEGKWIGTLNFKGMEIGIHFNVKKNTISKEETIYQSRIDVPVQKLKNYPVDQTSLKKKNVEFDILNLQAKFNGKFTDTNIISGTFVQNGQSIPLTLKKHWGPLKTDKPQTPKRPLNYKEEFVTFSNRDGKIKFAGTVTKPNISEKNELKLNYPTVVFYTGSGSQDRDETIGNHKLFAVLADLLTKQGYAVMRVDDRGAGETKMSPDKYDFSTKDLIEDGIDYVNFIKKYAEIDSTQIYLLGHSEGGSIAFGVAKSISNIKGIIGLAPPMCGGKEINIFQNFWALKNANAPNEVIESYLFLHEVILNELDKNDTVLSTTEKIASIKKCIDFWQKTDKIQIKNHHKKVKKYFEKQYKGKFETILSDLYSPLNESQWMRYFLQSNPATDAVQLKIPMIILQGKMDQQIPFDKSKEAVDQLKLVGRNIEFIGLEGHNHLLQRCKTGNPSEYLSLEETISQEAMDAMTHWLQQQTTNNSGKQ